MAQFFTAERWETRQGALVATSGWSRQLDIASPLLGVCLGGALLTRLFVGPYDYAWIQAFLVFWLATLLAGLRRRRIVLDPARREVRVEDSSLVGPAGAWAVAFSDVKGVHRIRVALPEGPSAPIAVGLALQDGIRYLITFPGVAANQGVEAVIRRALSEGSAGVPPSA